MNFDSSPSDILLTNHINLKETMDSKNEWNLLKNDNVLY